MTHQGQQRNSGEGCEHGEAGLPMAATPRGNCGSQRPALQTDVSGGCLWVPADGTSSSLAQVFVFVDTSCLGPCLLLPLFPHPYWGPEATQAPSPGLCHPVGEGCQPRSPPSWVPSGLVPLAAHCRGDSKLQETGLRPRAPGAVCRPRSGPVLSLSCVYRAHIKLASPGTSPAVQ